MTKIVNINKIVTSFIVLDPYKEYDTYSLLSQVTNLDCFLAGDEGKSDKYADELVKLVNEKSKNLLEVVQLWIKHLHRLKEKNLKAVVVIDGLEKINYTERFYKVRNMLT